MFPFVVDTQSFNTQPPEGGWISAETSPAVANGFNTQPPEGGWLACISTQAKIYRFQHTAARRRLDEMLKRIAENTIVSTHSRPKAAGMNRHKLDDLTACFNTQPPEGGWKLPRNSAPALNLFQHTAARRRLASRQRCAGILFMFQHTAARRRLDGQGDDGQKDKTVSTHSRPKAAGYSKSWRCNVGF